MARRAAAPSDSGQNQERNNVLSEVRKRLKKVDLGGGGNYYKPEVGRNVIRVLPGVGDMGVLFWQQVGTHYVSGTTFTCPRFTLDKPCPICETVSELYRHGDADSKDMASNLRMRRSYWVNVVDRGNEDQGVQIYTPGVQVFGSIAGFVEDPDYGAIYDSEMGRDIIITRSGTGLDTSYEVYPRPNQSPLHGDPKVMMEWLETAIDLSAVELTNDPSEDDDWIRDPESGEIVAVVTVLPYHRLKAEFDKPGSSASSSDGGEGEDAAEEDPFADDEEEGDDDLDDVRDIISKRRSRGSRRRR